MFRVSFEFQYSKGCNLLHLISADICPSLVIIERAPINVLVLFEIHQRCALLIRFSSQRKHGGHSSSCFCFVLFCFWREYHWCHCDLLKLRRTLYSDSRFKSFQLYPSLTWSQKTEINPPVIILISVKYWYWVQRTLETCLWFNRVEEAATW